ncbi:manganese catalase family protein [Bacillota bacterium Meth-B3]|nr:manganese catalase family protein [Christensenellaceae bacterium]
MHQKEGGIGVNTQTHMPVTIAMSQESTNNPNNEPAMTIYLNPAPYPKVSKGSDPATVKLLKEDYAGAVSELTAIMQYIYQNTLSTNDESFANGVLQVALVEMSHLDMLGDAILALGGNPTFGDGRVYWHGNLVNYARTLREMLMANIQSESEAIDNYERHAAMTTNTEVRSLLERIAEDERLHLRFFTELLEKLNS